MKKIRLTKEAKIGMVTIASIALLYFGVNYLKGINLFKPVNHYFVTFQNVKNLTISNPVYVEGFKIGLVRSIVYDYKTTDKITVEISLDDNMRINKGSHIILTNDYLSGAFLEIRLNKYADEFIKSGEVIEGQIGSDLMASIQDNLLPGVESLLPKIDSILTGLQVLVNHPALLQSLDHIEKTTGNLEISSRQLNQLLSKDVPVIMSDLKSITSNFNEISRDFKDLKLEETINGINETLSNLSLTTGKLNASDNTLGLLLNDRVLYDNLNSTMDNASKLLIDFREHPKKYVHFSLF